MKFIDLKKQDRLIKDKIEQAVINTMRSGHFIQGIEVREFEKMIQDYTGIKHAIGVGSGTAALDIAIQALSLPKNSEVITTPFTYFATTEAILRNNLRPVFADVELDTYSLDPESVKEVISEKTKAILPVHLFGKPCNMEAIVDIAENNGLRIIEDCAQSIGSRFKNKHVGGFGEAGCLSFYPTKNLGCYGDGGMIITNNDDMSERVRVIQQNGAIESYMHTEIGTNSRLDTIQAAILIEKLKILDELNQHRKKLATLYREVINEAKINKKLNRINLPYQEGKENHTYHQFTISGIARDKLKAFLEKLNIPTAIYYHYLTSEQPALNKRISIKGDLTNSKRLQNTVLSLPIAPHLSEDDIKKIGSAINDFYS